MMEIQGLTINGKTLTQPTLIVEDIGTDPTPRGWVVTKNASHTITYGANSLNWTATNFTGTSTIKATGKVTDFIQLQFSAAGMSNGDNAGWALLLNGVSVASDTTAGNHTYPTDAYHYQVLCARQNATTWIVTTNKYVHENNSYSQSTSQTTVTINSNNPSVEIDLNTLNGGAYPGTSSMTLYSIRSR